jgi:hypothetical protein
MNRRPAPAQPALPAALAEQSAKRFAPPPEAERSATKCQPLQHDSLLPYVTLAQAGEAPR